MLFINVFEQIYREGNILHGRTIDQIMPGGGGAFSNNLNTVNLKILVGYLLEDEVLTILCNYRRIYP